MTWLRDLRGPLEPGETEGQRKLAIERRQPIAFAGLLVLLAASVVATATGAYEVFAALAKVYP